MKKELLFLFCLIIIIITGCTKTGLSGVTPAASATATATVTSTPTSTTTPAISPSYECETNDDCAGKSTEVFCQGGDVWGNKVECGDNKCGWGRIENCNSQKKVCYEASGITALCVDCRNSDDCQPRFKCQPSRIFRDKILKSGCVTYDTIPGSISVPIDRTVPRDPKDWECVYEVEEECRSGTKCIIEGDSARCIIKPREDCEYADECPTYGNSYCNDEKTAVISGNCIDGECIIKVEEERRDCEAGEICNQATFGGKTHAVCIPKERIPSTPTPSPSSTPNPSYS